jgi:hypothetical protein
VSAEEGLVTRSRYPLGVVVVIVIAALRCVTIIATFIGLQSDGGVIDWVIVLVTGARAGSRLRARAHRPGHLIGILIASVLVVIGLLAHRRWAWVLAIVTSGFILAIDLGWWFSSEPRYISMLLNVIAVFYLNQPDVRLSLRASR